MLRSPAWRCWVKLVEFFSVALQHELTMEDLERMDDLMLEHSAMFDAVPQYAGMKRPKHHFAAHIPLDAWRHGPPRGYWTMGFEGFNKVIKAGAQRSNWRNESLSIMQYWSMRSARAMCE